MRQDSSLKTQYRAEELRSRVPSPFLHVVNRAYVPPQLFLQNRYDIRTIQQLLGHSDVRTTMIYTHTVPTDTIKEPCSPLDFWLLGSIAVKRDLLINQKVNYGLTVGLSIL